MTNDIYEQGLSITFAQREQFNAILPFWLERVSDGKGGIIKREHHEGPTNKDKYIREVAVDPERPFHEKPPLRFTDEQYDIVSSGKGFRIRNLQDDSTTELKHDSQGWSLINTNDPTRAKLNCWVQGGKAIWSYGLSPADPGTLIEHHFCKYGEAVSGASQRGDEPRRSLSLVYHNRDYRMAELEDELGNRVLRWFTGRTVSDDPINLTCRDNQGHSYEINKSRFLMRPVRSDWASYELSAKRDGSCFIETRGLRDKDIYSNVKIKVPPGAHVITWSDGTYQISKDGITKTVFPDDTVETTLPDGTSTREAAKFVEAHPGVLPQYMQAVEHTLSTIRQPLLDLVKKKHIKVQVVDTMAGYVKEKVKDALLDAGKSDVEAEAKGQEVINRNRPRGYPAEGRTHHVRGRMDGNMVVAQRVAFGNQWIWLPMDEVAYVLKHEFGHALDSALHLDGQFNYTDSKDFIDAHNADIANILAHNKDAIDKLAYYWQKDPVTGQIDLSAGRSETFAEVFGDPEGIAGQHFSKVKALLRKKGLIN